MQARGALMIEHRVIERMIALMEAALTQIEATNEIDPQFITKAVDFIRVYADRTHHGKEEDLLFRHLDKKDLAAADRRLMAELIQDHVHGRKTTKALADAGARYGDGDMSALAVVADSLRALAEFYPRHIKKEDEIFFPAARTYLTDDEDQTMLEEFWEFDRKMIHEKYKTVLEDLEGRSGP